MWEVQGGGRSNPCGMSREGVNPMSRGEATLCGMSRGGVNFKFSLDGERGMNISWNNLFT